MAKIIFLGTSSSIPSKTRDNTSFLFIHKNQNFLIDCPGSIAQKLLKVNFNFKKLSNIIITHEHPDHIYGIISIIHTQAYFNNNLTIFSNPPCIKIIKQLVKLFNLNSKHYPKIQYINILKKDFLCFKNDLRIKAVKNNHIKNSFGIKICFGKKSLLYSSDTRFSKKMLEKAGDINYLIHDCTASLSFFERYPLLYNMHTCAEELTNYLKHKPDIKLIPVHLLLFEKEEEKNIKKGLRNIRNQLIFVKDFDTLLL